jgi:hypothetical protein
MANSFRKKLEAAGQHIRRRRAEQNYTMSENDDSWVWVYGKNLSMSFTDDDSDLPFHFMAIPSIGVLAESLDCARDIPCT